MPRRGDNIRKRKDGRWEARYVLDDCNCNTKKYRSVYGRTYQEAKEKREIITTQARQQKLISKEIFFADLLAAWQASNKIRLKESSVSRYQNLIDLHILPVLGDKQMGQINTSAINHFLTEKLERGRLNSGGELSSPYVRSIALIINSAIRYGVTEDMCQPLKSTVTKPSLHKKELTLLSTEKQAILEQELLNNMNEDKLLIYITLYTGIRIGEAVALRWEDIDLDAKLLYVRQTVTRVWFDDNGIKKSKLVTGSPKTQSSHRCIPICSKLYTILLSFPSHQKRGYILINSNGNFISPRTFEYRYKAILKKCALVPINYHALRHTFATRCIERGVDIKSLSEVLGHSNVSITVSIRNRNTNIKNRPSRLILKNKYRVFR